MVRVPSPCSLDHLKGSAMTSGTYLTANSEALRLMTPLITFGEMLTAKAVSHFYTYLGVSQTLEHSYGCHI